MRLFKKALYVIAIVLLVSRGTPGADHPTWDPPPFPDDLPPWPDDPPPIFDDPYDPATGLPNPLDLPPPPEDFDDLPLPDPWDIPDPPDFDDPFPNFPSLLPDPFEDLPDFPDIPLPPPPEAVPGPRALTATNLVTKLIPFPMRIPFHPSYSGKSAPARSRTCNPALGSQLVIPGPKANTVGFFSTCPHSRTATVSVGIGPVKAAPAPDGKQVLVGNIGDGSSSGTISVIDLASHSVVKTITFPAADANGAPVSPNNIAFLPDNSRAYVTSHQCNPTSFVYIIDMSSLSVTGSIPVGCYPSGMAVSPDGSQVWVSSHGDSRVDVFDTTTNEKVTSYDIGFPNGIAFNPTGTRAYIAESGDNSLWVVDTSTYHAITRVPVGNLPHVVRVSPSGHDVFVTNALSNTISRINADTNVVIQTWPLPNNDIHPLGLAFIP
ncbi:MAG TPA: YncE family protein [Bryobacteraceae bacterium]|nr:YncE family protein [Bryobacteraceae bacterium]